jgi:hypothetical protein
MSALSRPTPGINQPRRALLIDSSPELNSMLTDLCDQHDWDIRSAKDNQEALELSQSRPFDLIITGERTFSPQDIELLGRLRLVPSHPPGSAIDDAVGPPPPVRPLSDRWTFSWRPVRAIC